MTFLTLDPVNGPSCPRCGCRDVKILQYPPEPGSEHISWMQPEQGRARCHHCGMPFTFKELPGLDPPAAEETHTDSEFEPAEFKEPVKQQSRDVSYPVRECPECKSPETTVKSSGKKPKPGMPRIRYHACKDCKATFKSVDRRHLKAALRVVS